jgi:hypothetical protein
MMMALRHFEGWAGVPRLEEELDQSLVLQRWYRGQTVRCC